MKKKENAQEHQVQLGSPEEESSVTQLTRLAGISCISGPREQAGQIHKVPGHWEEPKMVWTTAVLSPSKLSIM